METEAAATETLEEQYVSYFKHALNLEINEDNAI